MVIEALKKMLHMIVHKLLVGTGYVYGITGVSYFSSFRTNASSGQVSNASID